MSFSASKHLLLHVVVSTPQRANFQSMAIDANSVFPITFTAINRAVVFISGRGSVIKKRLLTKNLSEHSLKGLPCFPSPAVVASGPGACPETERRTVQRLHYTSR